MDRKQEELGVHILENIRNELYYYFPYLDGAFACIHGEASDKTRTIGTDGEAFLFSPQYLMELYVKKPEAVRRGYLHMLLHCLYLHIFRWPDCGEAVVSGVYRKVRTVRLLENGKEFPFVQTSTGRLIIQIGRAHV